MGNSVLIKLHYRKSARAVKNKIKITGDIFTKIAKKTVDTGRNYSHYEGRKEVAVEIELKRTEIGPGSRHERCAAGLNPAENRKNRLKIAKIGQKHDKITDSRLI